MADIPLQTPASWEADDSKTNCSSCQVEFSFFVRKHHCRRDGKIYCGDCSSKSAPLPKFGFQTPVRVCDRCYEETIRENRFLCNFQPFLSEGGMLIRYTARDEPAPIVLKLSPDTRRLTWHSTQLIRNQPASFDSMSLENITSVKPGAEGDLFQCYQNMNYKRNQCFSLIAKRPGGYLSLDLEASNPEDRDKWVEALLGAKEYYQGGNTKTFSSTQKDQERLERERQREEERKKRTEDIKQKYNIGRG